MSYEEKKTTVGTSGKAHSLSMEGRKKLTLTGVVEVESFDEHEIVMTTACGALIIRGEDLGISRLSVDSGDVNVQGMVTSLSYEESVSGGSLWSRLFR